MSKTEVLYCLRDFARQLLPRPRFSLLPLTLFLALLIGSVAVATVAAPTTYAKKKQRSTTGRAINPDGIGYSIEASYYVGQWNCRDDCFGGENTLLYLVNTVAQTGGKNDAPDPGIDVLLFVYGLDSSPITCGRVHLIGNQAAEISIGDLEVPSEDDPTFVGDGEDQLGVIKLLVYRPEDVEFAGEDGGTKPISWPLGAWTLQDNVANLLSGPAAELFPVPLAGRELEDLRNDFGPDFGPETCFFVNKDDEEEED